MANTLNVSALPEYIEQKKDELFVKAVAGTKSVDYLDIMAGVKHKEALHYLDSEVVLADGSTCGWNPQGSDTFSEKAVEVFPISVQKEFCWKDMKDKYMNYQLLWQAGRETLPFEEKIAESNMVEIQNAVDKMIWQGDATVKVDGLIAQLKAEDDAVKVTFDAGATVTEKIDAMVEKIPVGAFKKGTVYIYLSITDFGKYVREQNANCCANRALIDAASATLTYVGDSRIVLVPLEGLEGANAMVAAPKEALVYATDIEGSEGVYEMFFDKKESKFDFNVLFVAGTAVRYPWLAVVGNE